MKFYYFNTHVGKNLTHEVHTEDCSFKPTISNRTLIGYFFSFDEAIEYANNKYPAKSFVGCNYCCNPSHAK